MTTINSREFNQNVSRAKRAASKGPVVITDRGKPAWVILRHDAYLRLTRNEPGILELLAMPGIEDLEFDIPRAEGLFRPAEFD